MKTNRFWTWEGLGTCEISVLGRSYYLGDVDKAYENLLGLMRSLFGAYLELIWDGHRVYFGLFGLDITLI